MGTWGDESCSSHETQNENETNLGTTSSNGTHLDENENDVDVEVDVVVGGNGEGDGCQIHENVNGGNEEFEEKEAEAEAEEESRALARQLERVVLQGSVDNDGYGEGGVEGVESHPHSLRPYGNEVEGVESHPHSLRPYSYEVGEGQVGGVGGGGGDDEWKNHPYPLRAYASDCAFYVKTGTCKFGQGCRFNHPPVRPVPGVGDQEKGIEQSNGLLADPGKIECKYFQTPGGCKYGDACRYNHSTQKVETESPALNFLGLPKRPSAQECTFYLRTGSCGYGVNCRFNHPDPSAAKGNEAVNSLANGKSVTGGINFPRNYAGESLQSFGVSQRISQSANGMTLRNGLPYAPEMSSYHQSAPQNPGWNQNQVTNPYQATKPSLQHQLVSSFSNKPGPSTHYDGLLQMEEFPIRPGQPDCDYFMKTGTCKYRSACRYNHPISGASKLRLPPVSSKGPNSRPAAVLPVDTREFPSSNPSHVRKTGIPTANHHQQIQSGDFPERPGQPECDYYMKTGYCKYKSACRFDHPKNRVSAPSACVLNEKGLPLRPGAKICRNYEQLGMCKYGRNCLFHHPDHYSPAVQAAIGAPRVHSSTNNGVAANLVSPAGNNVGPDWDDGWAM